MEKEKKIRIARNNWIKASKQIGFILKTPYHFTINGEDKVAFAFLPEYGSINGMVVALMFLPMFEMDDDIIKWAKANQCFYSFINIDGSLVYDKKFIMDSLDDWGKFG